MADESTGENIKVIFKFDLPLFILRCQFYLQYILFASQKLPNALIFIKNSVGMKFAFFQCASNINTVPIKRNGMEGNIE